TCGGKGGCVSSISKACRCWRVPRSLAASRSPRPSRRATHSLHTARWESARDTGDQDRVGTGRSGRGMLGGAEQCPGPVLGSWRFPPARAFVCPDGYSAQHRGVLFISVPCSALFTLNRDAAIRPRLAGHWVARALGGKVRFARYERRKQDRTSPSPIESS